MLELCDSATVPSDDLLLNHGTSFCSAEFLLLCRITIPSAETFAGL